MTEGVYLAKTSANPSVDEVLSILSEGLMSLGGLRDIIRYGSRVLVKPNLGVPALPESARVTDPRVLEAVILALCEAGAGEVIIGEASVVGFDTEEAFEVSGIREVAKRTGASLVDLKKQSFVKIPVPNPLALNHIYLSSVAMEADVIINVPKLKTIAATPISVAMKNLKGLIPDQEKKRFHYTDLNACIVDLNKVARPALTVVDGIIAHEMYEPKEINLLIAGRDPVAVDTVSCLIIECNPAKVQYLAEAARLGLGIGTVEKIKVFGERIEDVSVPVETAPDSGSAFAAHFPEVIIEDGYACSGCSGSLFMALKTARAKGLLTKADGVTFAIGKEASPRSSPDNTLYIGRCLRGFKDSLHYLDGCPFSFMQLVDYIEMRFQGRKKRDLE